MLFLGYRHWSLRWALKIVAQNCGFDRIHWRGSDTGKNIGWLSTSNGQACGSPRPQSLFVLCPTSSPGRQDSGCRIPHHFLPSLPQSDGFKYRNLTWATSQWINGQVYYYIPKRILNRPHISSYIHISGALKPPYRHFPSPLRSTRPQRRTAWQRWRPTCCWPRRRRASLKTSWQRRLRSRAKRRYDDVFQRGSLR